MTSPTEPVLLEIYLHVIEKNGEAGISLRREVWEPDIKKQIISAAYHEQPIILLPRFRNKLNALNALQQKGIIYFNAEAKEYFFVDEAD